MLCAQCAQEYYATLRPKSINDCLLSDGKDACSIGDIANEYGEKAVLAFLMTAILDYVDFIGDKNLSPLQVKKTASEIFAIPLARNMNVKDIRLVFSEMLREKQYGAVNAGKIVAAFASHMTDRLNAADDMSYSEHMRVKEQPTDYSIAKQFIRQTSHGKN